MAPGETQTDLARKTREAVRAHYGSDPIREWERLDRHRTEYAVSLRALRDHLPPPPAQVLDCGGGPGRYAIALAELGYQVTLFDLSAELLALAEQRATEAGVTILALVEGTATDLSRFADRAFDAVLLMGPLYHLLDEDSRRAALLESARVVRPGGPVFAAFISRYAGHRDCAANYPRDAAEHPDLYDRIEQTGQLLPREDGSARFVAYFTHPSEVRPLCRSAGLEVDVVLGVEGVVIQKEGEINALDGAAWERWLATNYRVAHDPAMLGCADHLLAVCRSPRWRTALKHLAQRLNEAGLSYRLVGGAALAVRGLDIEVTDLDLELCEADAYAFGDRFADRVVFPVQWRASTDIRSHYGRFEVCGVEVDVMARLERRVKGRWVPSFARTELQVDLEDVAVTTTSLEEETIAYLRRGRLDRVSLALPHCNANALVNLVREAVTKGWL